MDVLPEEPKPIPQKFKVESQEVHLDVDFATQTIYGNTSIKVRPLLKDLKEVQLRCRQMTITSVKVDKDVIKNYKHSDSYLSLVPRDGYTVHQHHWIQSRIDDKIMHCGYDMNLPLPSHLSRGQQRLTLRLGSSLPTTPQVYEPGEGKEFTIHIEYTMRNVRDGLQWVGLDPSDKRYPHVYSYNKSLAHTTGNYLFPTLWDETRENKTRCTWKFSITCPRTMGDLFKPSASQSLNTPSVDNLKTECAYTESDQALDMAVVCSGYMEDDDAPINDREYRRKWIFTCDHPVLARHIGFAIGPFERFDLAQYREQEDDTKMGQSAVSVHGFCLPGRVDDLKNTCMPVATAIDRLSTNYVFYPFENSKQSSYKMCFVDDLPMNVVDTATFSICSSRLLIPETVQDPLFDATREIIRAVASQWLGVKVIAKLPEDSWVIVGSAYFMADSFMQGLWGKNEHRYRMKMAADKLLEQDINRPSLYRLGAVLEVDQGEYEFLKLKAPLVLSILHHRILKLNGRIGVNRAISRILLDDMTGKLEDGQLDTDRMVRSCEKVSHNLQNKFFDQWVYRAGCPTFRVTQRFNKKKMVVDMQIQQTVGGSELNLDTSIVRPDSFLREAKEDEERVEAGPFPDVFTGPMTIRIHEADGTPYEHIVEIKEPLTRIEIPYKTKYKRLKRNRRAKERAAAAAGVDESGDPVENEPVLYCFGDILTSEEEMAEWGLAEWSKDDEAKMNNEHYEWIRLDKDFEWIANISFNQPHYMWVSQLQQDNDVVAHVEALHYLRSQPPHPLVSTFLLRTLMDDRYFYGLRCMAALCLPKCAVPHLNWIGLVHLQKAFKELYCVPDSKMPKSNDFADVRKYRVQCAIVEACAKIRDESGRTPDSVKQFFLDMIKFNDNSNNVVSDAYYQSLLMAGLAESVKIPPPPAKKKGLNMSFDFDDLDMMDDEAQRKAMEEDRLAAEQKAADEVFLNLALTEIHRIQRIDPWIPSYMNIFTVTALNSIKELMLNGALKRKFKDFVNYTRPTNSPPVRLKAFECLVDLGLFKEPSVMEYFFTSFYLDNSPYFRNKIWLLIGQALARLGIDANHEASLEESTLAPIAPAGGLVVEAGDSAQKKAPTPDTIHAVISQLKHHLSPLEGLESTILEALRSSKIGIDHVLDLVTLCRMIYTESDSLILKLRLPPYYKAIHRGGGKVTFKSTGRYRTRPFTTLAQRGYIPVPSREPSPDIPLASLKRTLDEALPSTEALTAPPPKRVAGSHTNSRQPTPVHVPKAPSRHTSPLSTSTRRLRSATPGEPPLAVPPPSVPVSKPPTVPLSVVAPPKPAKPRSPKKSRVVVLKIGRDIATRWPVGEFGVKGGTVKEKKGVKRARSGSPAAAPRVKEVKQKVVPPPVEEKKKEDVGGGEKKGGIKLKINFGKLKK